jgi:hypothetical protein
MSNFDEFRQPEEWEQLPPDPAQEKAFEKLHRLFREQRERVFFARQLEVMHEDDFFHWVTSRAAGQLEGKGLILSELRPLRHGGNIKLMWNASFRYYRRKASEVVKLVEEYAHPNIGGALGNHGELMVLEGFAKRQFVLQGRNSREFRSKKWVKTDHDLDFIFERDSRAYGVEVKNMLGYMEYRELRIKIDLCREIGVRPVFVARMLPKSWIHEIWKAGGFALILKYQLYPPAHKDLAKSVASQLGLPVDAPKALADGTIERFVRWHLQKGVNQQTNSPAG